MIVGKVWLNIWVGPSGPLSCQQELISVSVALNHYEYFYSPLQGFPPHLTEKILFIYLGGGETVKGL